MPLLETLTKKSNPIAEVGMRKTVQTRSGDIMGKEVASKEGFSHFEFHGIPFAQPPVGELRFKEPRPVRPWTNILEIRPL